MVLVAAIWRGKFLQMVLRSFVVIEFFAGCEADDLCHVWGYGCAEVEIVGVYAVVEWRE